jgi:hypothetical protein
MWPRRPKWDLEILGEMEGGELAGEGQKGNSLETTDEFLLLNEAINKIKEGVLQTVFSVWVMFVRWPKQHSVLEEKIDEHVVALFKAKALAKRTARRYISIAKGLVSMYEANYCQELWQTLPATWNDMSASNVVTLLTTAAFNSA